MKLLNWFTIRNEQLVCKLAWAAFPKSIISLNGTKWSLRSTWLTMLLGNAAQANSQMNPSVWFVNWFKNHHKCLFTLKRMIMITITTTIQASTPTHGNILFIIGYGVWDVKCLSPLKSDGFWLVFNVFIIHQLEKYPSECDSNDIVPLCRYCHSCGVGVTILIELKWWLNLIMTNNYENKVEIMT